MTMICIISHLGLDVSPKYENIPDYEDVGAWSTEGA